MGVAQNHPFLDGIFHEINHPAMGVPPWLWKPPYLLETIVNHYSLLTIYGNHYYSLLITNHYSLLTIINHYSAYTNHFWNPPFSTSTWRCLKEGGSHARCGACQGGRCHGAFPVLTPWYICNMIMQYTHMSIIWYVKNIRHIEYRVYIYIHVYT